MKQVKDSNLKSQISESAASKDSTASSKVGGRRKRKKEMGGAKDEELAAADFIRKVQAATGVKISGKGWGDEETQKLRGDYLVFDAWERPYYLCLALTSLVVMYTVTFVMETVVGSVYMWLGLDLLADLVYIGDSFVQSRTGYLKNGILVCDRWLLLRHYLKTPTILLDIGSLLPTDILYFSGNVGTLGMARLNRLLRAHRFFDFLDRTWRLSSRPNLTRGATLALYMLIIVHWNACAYYQVSSYIGFGSDRWVFNKSAHPSVHGQYLTCVYWVAMTFTTGESLAISPFNLTESLFVVVNVLVSISVFATIVGNISALVAEYSAKRYTFLDWYEDTKEYMKKRNISQELQDRVSAWFQHYWFDNAASGGKEDDLEMLPEHLKAEINMNAHLETLQRVKIFQDCEPGLLLALVNKLTLALFNPHETICLKGDVGKEMYIVKSGKLQVFGANGALLVTLGAGAAFGELALLNIEGTKTGNRRTATVVSEGYSYLFVLTKEDLWVVLEDFPEAKNVFMNKGREILIKDGLIDPSKTGDSNETAEEKSSRLLKTGDHLLNRMSTTLVGIIRQDRMAQERIRKLEKELAEVEKEITDGLRSAAHNYGTDSPF